MKPSHRQTIGIATLCATSFFFGFFSYLGIEKCYKRFISRSSTHWTMGLIAGLSFLFLLALDKKKMPLFLKALAGGTFITLFELVFGVILNLHYHLNVWDYRKNFGNFKGQICPFFSFIWCLSSFAVIAVNRLFLLLYRKTPFSR